MASLAADLAKRPARDEVEARASEAFAAASDAHAAIAAAEDRFAQRSDDDAAQARVDGLTSRAATAPRVRRRARPSRKLRNGPKPRGRGRGRAPEKPRRQIQGRGPAREEEKRRLERRCDVLSREAHKAPQGLLFRTSRRWRGGIVVRNVRQNVREGCEFAVASANDALDEAKTELSRLANDGAPSDATSVGAGLARNVATLVDARAAAVSDTKVARVPGAAGRGCRDVATHLGVGT